MDVRVIAATHHDLAAEVREGRFRDDLYYRLNVINIRLPPLRERREDVPLLAQEFLDRLAHELGRGVSGISEEALRVLMDHDWPGNVRELEREYIAATLQRTQGNVKAAAEALGIDRSTLYEKVKRYDIPR